MLSRPTLRAGNVETPILKRVLRSAGPLPPALSGDASSPWAEASLSLDEVIDAYDHASQVLNTRQGHTDPQESETFRSELSLLVREKETVLRGHPDDPRHDFFIVIPVAERPLMLQNCLNSLRAHVDEFPYGRELHMSPIGTVRDKFTVIIVDDSKNPVNIASHRAIAESLPGQGLRSEYLGLEEQQDLLRSLPADQRHSLHRMIGPLDDAGVPGHKGPSVSRNLAHLFLARRLAESPSPERALIWYVDSDEEFTSLSDEGAGVVLAFFHEIDRVFRTGDIDVLTGKVFGDPPVAPAVMTGGLLEDLDACLQTIMGMNPDEPCVFHADKQIHPHSAAYNDLRSLFGFSEPVGPIPFQCPVREPHVISDALKAVAEILPAFFHGRHPTRPIPASAETRIPLTPARTVYTGNYVLRPTALGYFIPFAPLRLRMAGPVLGRLLRKDLGDRFLAGPFPLLHRRVLPGQAESEFRAGVSGAEMGHNLSRELESQFWGDVVLFTLETLVEGGYPDVVPPYAAIVETLRETTGTLQTFYDQNRTKVKEKSKRLLAAMQGGSRWRDRTELQGPLERIKSIVLSLDAGFSPHTLNFTGTAEFTVTLNRLAAYIEAYPADHRNWQSVVNELFAGT